MTNFFNNEDNIKIDPELGKIEYDGELDYIEITDGDETKKLLLLDTFGIEETDYASLLDEENEQLYIFEVDFEGDEAVFSPIEDEAELEEIIAIYSDILDDMDED